MENNAAGKKIIDAVTVALLAIAFAVAFVMGFVLKRPEGVNYLSSTILFVVSVGGLGILYASGVVTELVSRIKRKEMTKGSVVMFSVCTVCYIALVFTMLALACQLTSSGSFLPRFVYIVTAASVIVGYALSSVYAAKTEALQEETAEEQENEAE